MMSKGRILPILEILVIVVMAIFPVFLSYPYRVNIFISWEGAYRMSNGEMPFSDFGIPMGYGFWAVPALFFKLFGPQMITLIKAQAFINILSGLAFRSILRSFRVPVVLSFVSVLFYVLTYSLVNFWPWYNHSVIVYEFVSLAFLFAYLLRSRKWIWLVLAGFFGFFSFFTKQDGGGLGLLMSLVFLAYDSWMEKDWKGIVIYLLAYAISAALIIVPLNNDGFSFWFNLGQAPHSSRVSIKDVIIGLLAESQLLRLSIFLVALMGFALFFTNKVAFFKKDQVLFLLLVLGILAQATILQETSYTPPDNNIYFISFVFAWLLYALHHLLPIPWNRWGTLVGLCAAILFLQSSRYAGYINGLLQKKQKPAGILQQTPEGENLVGRNNFLLYLNKKGDIPVGEWVRSDVPVLKGMKLPKPTEDGVQRVLAMPEMKKGDPKVLNMTELTPLAAAVPFGYEKGVYLPLWHHLGVAMFNKQAELYEKQISKKYYDVVLFEYLPGLNNFFPFRVRDSLQLHYRKVDSFYAPRMGYESMGTVEVYRR
jgi:hypothetical protein